VIARLGDVASVESGFAFKSKDWQEFGVPVVKIRNVRDGRVDLDGCSFVASVVADAASRYELSNGDVLITMTGEIGSIGVVRTDSRVMLNQRVGRVKLLSDRVSSTFLALALQHPRLKLRMESIAYGAAQPNISPALIESLPVWIPLRQKQDEIVEKLAAFDELIENNRRRIEILEEMARLLYREWFVHFRFPGHEDVELVDSELGPIPEGWEATPFADLAEFINGFAFKSSEHWHNHGLPIVKIKELKSGVSKETLRYHGEDIKAKYFINDGDVLFSWSADLEAYLWSDGPGLLNQHLFVVRPYELAPLFLFHSLRGHMSHFRARAQGTTMKHIKRSALTEVAAVVPSRPCLDKFVAEVGPLAELQINLTQQNRVLREARDLLLPRGASRIWLG